MQALKSERKFNFFEITHFNGIIYKEKLSLYIWEQQSDELEKVNTCFIVHVQCQKNVESNVVDAPRSSTVYYIYRFGENAHIPASYS